VGLSGRMTSSCRAVRWRAGVPSLTTQGNAVDCIVLGVGVNLNVTHEDLRVGLGETARTATSLREALGSADGSERVHGTISDPSRGTPGHLPGLGRAGNPGRVARLRRRDGTTGRSSTRADRVLRSRPQRRCRGAPPGQGHPQTCPHGRHGRGPSHPVSFRDRAAPRARR
jgi:hypothetical protein